MVGARGECDGPSRAFPKFESYGMLETAASVGWKVKDAIVGFHGIGRLGMGISLQDLLWAAVRITSTDPRQPDARIRGR